MDSARDTISGKIIEAEQLWLLYPFKTNTFLCVGCDAIVTPCSYQPKNKKRPYFSAKQGHSNDCSVDKRIDLVEQTQTGRIVFQDNSSDALPQKLVLQNKRPIDQIGSATSCSIKKSQPTLERIKKKSKIHCRAISALRPICYTFINLLPNQDIPLRVSKISGNTYRDIFLSLTKNKIIHYSQLKIFYASISWKKLVLENDYLDIQLNAGEWGDRGFSRPYRVRIHWNNWRAAKRTHIADEVENVRLKTIESKGTGKLFFIGEQDNADLSIFHVEDHKRICCLVDENEKPVKRIKTC